jgi:hypothetical protein
MNISYESHPSFRFRNDELDELNIPADLFNLFCQNYTFIQSQGRVLPPKIVEKASNQCKGTLETIFNNLRDQTAVERRKLFLDELKLYSQSLLLDDLRYFTRVSNLNNSYLLKAQESSFVDAYSLVQSRYFTKTLDSKAVNKILNISRSTIETFRQLAATGKNRREDLSVNSGPLPSQIATILHQEFERLGVNQSVSLYMGQKMRVTGLALELSLPSATWWKNTYSELSRDPKTKYFHIDESPAFPKAIVYLTEVSNSSGPTSVAENVLEKLDVNPLQLIVGRIFGKIGREPTSPLFGKYSHIYHQGLGCPLFRQDFMSLPSQMRWNSHFGWDVIPDSDLESFMISNEQVILGKPGTFLVFDGAHLLHRGGLLEIGERIALQVIFGPENMNWKMKNTLRILKNKLITP